MEYIKIGDKDIGYSNKEGLDFIQSIPMGTDIGLDDNECECATYYLGDHRCECGNRRVHVMLDSYNGKYFLRTEAY